MARCRIRAAAVLGAAYAAAVVWLYAGSQRVNGGRLLPAAIQPAFHPWAEQLDRHLDAYSESGITAEMLDGAQQRLSSVGRVKIINNTIYIQDEYADHQPAYNLLLPIQRLLCCRQVPDIEFLLTWGDGARKTRPPVPLLGWCHNSYSWDVPIPYPYFYRTDYHEDEIPYHPSWDSQLDTAYWRGATTGGPYTPDTWRDVPRPILVQKCHQRPDLCDAEFTKYGKKLDGSDVREEMRQELGAHEYEPFETSFQHRYVIIVDGNSASARRTLGLFGGPSVLLWQESRFQEFFQSALRPYVHYLPLAYNLSDLYQTIEWARANPESVQSIRSEARRFRKQYLNGNTVNRYVFDLITRYSALQTAAPRHSSGFTPFMLKSATARSDLVERSGGQCAWGNVTFRS